MVMSPDRPRQEQPDRAQAQAAAAFVKKRVAAAYVSARWALTDDEAAVALDDIADDLGVSAADLADLVVRSHREP